MIVRLSLGGVKDWDLIYLHKHPEFGLSSSFRQALRGYVREHPVKIQLPRENPEALPQSGEKTQVSISLNEQTDQDVITWIQSIKKGYRGCAIRMIFRSCLEKPCLYGFTVDAPQSIQPPHNKKQNKKAPAKQKEQISSSQKRKEPQTEHKKPQKPKPEKEVEEFDIFSDDFANNF